MPGNIQGGLGLGFVLLSLAALQTNFGFSAGNNPRL